MKNYVILQLLPEVTHNYWRYCLFHIPTEEQVFADEIEKFTKSELYKAINTLEELQKDYQVIAEVDSLEELKTDYPELFI